MDQMPKHPKPTPRRRGILWDGLNRGTAWLYAVILQSFPGRVLTSYHAWEHRLLKQKRSSGERCAPMTQRRFRVVQAVESSLLFRMGRAVSRGLFACPMNLYGVFGVVYSILCAILYFVAPLINEGLGRGRDYLISAIVLAVFSLVLLFSTKTLAGALGGSALCRAVFSRFLGIPEDRLQVTSYKSMSVEYFLAGYAALMAAIGSLFLPTLAIPLALLAFGFIAMIMTYPEIGVVLFSLTLPAVWLDNRLLLVAEALILLTWVSYGLKLIRHHRTIRFSLLDRVLLVFGIIILLSGITGGGINSETLRLGVSLFICLSSYFLIVNLIHTRAYVRSCLLGVGVSVAVVTFLAYIRLVPVDGLSWLEGSRAGDALVEGIHRGYEQLSGLWVEHSELYLVLTFPWLYAFLIHTKRLVNKIMGALFILLNLFLIVETNSISSLICIIGVTVLFFLMVGHKSLSAGLVALPVVGCGFYWFTYLYPLTDALQTILSRSRLYKSQLADSLWRMAWDYPAGIGAGEEAFAAVYPFYAAPDLGAVSDSGNLFFELLLSFGWVGALVACAALFLFVQKSLTCLSQTPLIRDRAMILGGVTSVFGFLIFGTVRSFITSPRVFFTLLLVLALCSAYEDIMLEEKETLEAERMNAPQATDRVYSQVEYNHTKE